METAKLSSCIPHTSHHVCVCYTPILLRTLFDSANLCFMRGVRHEQVAEAMLQAAASVNVGGETFITTPTDGGAYVVSAEPKFSDGAIRYPGDV